MRITISGCVAGLFAVVVIPPALRAQMGHGHHPAIAQQRYALEARFLDGATSKVITVPIELNDATSAQTLSQTVLLPAPLAPIEIRAFLPSAKLTQEINDDSSGTDPAATLVSIEGPKQSATRWLVADDPQRNRLTSLIGTWRFMTVNDSAQRDQLFHEFASEYTRSPRLNISATDGAPSTTVVAEPGTIHDLPGLGGTVTVLEFYTHYAVSDETSQPVNVSAKRVNPAVLVKLAHGDVNERRWVFAQFPDYTTGEPQRIPWKLTLDCPAEGKTPRPDVAVVFTRPNRWETWLRHAGKTVSQQAVLDELVDLPSSQYRFRLQSMVPSGRLVETYSATEDAGGVQAVRIEVAGVADGSVSVWLTPGKPHHLPGDHGPVTLTLQTGLAPGGSHP